MVAAPAAAKLVRLQPPRCGALCFLEGSIQDNAAHPSPPCIPSRISARKEFSHLVRTFPLHALMPTMAGESSLLG